MNESGILEERCGNNNLLYVKLYKLIQKWAKVEKLEINQNWKIRKSQIKSHKYSFLFALR